MSVRVLRHEVARCPDGSVIVRRVLEAHGKRGTVAVHLGAGLWAAQLERTHAPVPTPGTIVQQLAERVAGPGLDAEQLRWMAEQQEAGKLEPMAEPWSASHLERVSETLAQPADLARWQQDEERRIGELLAAERAMRAAGRKAA